MRSVTTFALLCLAATPQLLAADYNYRQIDFPNAESTEARGINARGDIVGSYTDAENVSHGFLKRDAVFTSIDFPGAAFTRGARVINNRGEIVGTFSDTAFVQHGYLLRDGQFSQIDFPGAGATTALGLNDAGDVTGSFIHETLGSENGYILRDGVFEGLQMPGGSTTMQVFSVQDNGRVFVGAALRPGEAFRGFISDESGKSRWIIFPGSQVSCTSARWINQQGDIVGLFSEVEDSDDCVGEGNHGFLLRSGEYTRIDIGGSIATAVLSINDDGVIVGRFTDSDGITHGFVAVPQEEP